MNHKCLFLAILLLSPAAFGDTIDLTDGTSWNGKVEYKDSDFTLNARSPGERKMTLHLARERIEKIEINENDYNPGTPPTWLASDSISGCLIGSPANSRFFLVPNQQSVAIQVTGGQDLGRSAGKNVTIRGTWQPSGNVSDTTFQVHSISPLGRSCDDAGETSVWKKLLQGTSQLNYQERLPNKKPEESSIQGPCTSPVDAIVLLDEAKHEGCLSEINETSVGLINDRFPRKKVRVIILGR